MVDPVSPNHIQELLAGYALGDLSPEEAEQLRQLLANHPEIEAEMQQLQEVLAAMPYALPPTEPPTALKASLLQAAAQSPVPVRHRWPLRVIGSSIAALLILALSVDNLRQRQYIHQMDGEITALQTQVDRQQTQLATQKDTLDMLREPKTKLVSLRGMDPMSDACGNLVITPGQGEAVVMLQKLPVLPDGQSYYLWAAIAGQNVALRGFNADDQGKVFFKVPLAKLSGDGKTGLAVTIEVSPDPTQPQGPMVMTSSL